MMTTLYLIRHGETEGADERRYKGTMDVPLSERGVQQIKQVSEYIIQNRSSRSVGTNSLNNLNPETSGNDSNVLDAVYSSDLSRAIKSAEIIAAPSRLKPVIIPELRERNFGIWEGMSFDEIREKYLEEFNVWAENPVKFSPMEGESTLDVRERVIRAFDEIIGKHNGEYIGIVAHGGVNRIILCHIMGIPLENIFRIEQNFAAINIIEFWDNYPVVKLINYIVQDSLNNLNF